MDDGRCHAAMVFRFPQMHLKRGKLYFLILIFTSSWKLHPSQIIYDKKFQVILEMCSFTKVLRASLTKKFASHTIEVLEESSKMRQKGSNHKLYSLGPR